MTVIAFLFTVLATLFSPTHLFALGDAGISQLQQWRSTTTPYRAITPQTSFVNIYAPSSWATTTGLTTTTLCLTADSCRATWPIGTSTSTKPLMFSYAVSTSTTASIFNGPLTAISSSTQTAIKAENDDLTGYSIFDFADGQNGAAAYLKYYNTNAGSDAGNLVLWNTNNKLVLFGVNNQAAASFSTNGVNTIFEVYGGPTGNQQEATVSTSLNHGGGNRQWTDWTTQDYSGVDLHSSINIARSGTDKLIPFVMRYWDSNLGFGSAGEYDFFFSNPSGVVAIGHFASTTGARSNRYLSQGPVLQVGASSTAVSEFAVYNSDTVSSDHIGFIVNQNGTTGIGTGTPAYNLDIYSTATTTARLDSNSSKGGCLIMKDSDGVGYSYISAANGVLTASTVPCI